MDKPLFNTFIKLNRNTAFKVRGAITEWFNGVITREQALDEAASAVAAHMRQTGQSTDGINCTDIAEALFAWNYTGSRTPIWFDDTEDTVEEGEEIGARALEILNKPMPLAA